MTSTPNAINIEASDALQKLLTIIKQVEKLCWASPPSEEQAEIIVARVNALRFEFDSSKSPQGGETVRLSLNESGDSLITEVAALLQVSNMAS